MKSNISKEIKQYNALWCKTNAAYEDWAKQYHLSYYELLIFVSLWDEEEFCTQRMLRDQWTLPKQTVHSILKNFEKKNWVYLESMERDRRNKAIYLTKEGRKFVKRVMEDLQFCEQTAWEKLGEQRRKALLENTALYLKYFKGEGQNENQ